VKPALALSLHTTQGRAARAGCCRARRASTPASWWTRAEACARATGYPLQVQWTLLEGVNDGDEELDGVARCWPAATPCST
jgi:23S rRNA (adenine2503-C2)-methyltransferase